MLANFSFSLPSVTQYAAQTFVSAKKNATYALGEVAHSLDDIYSLNGLTKFTNAARTAIKCDTEFRGNHAFDLFFNNISGHKAIILFIKPLKSILEFVQGSKEKGYYIGFNSKQNVLERVSKVFQAIASIFKDYAFCLKYHLGSSTLSNLVISAVGEERAENNAYIKQALTKPDDFASNIVSGACTLNLLAMGYDNFKWNTLTKNNLTNRDWWSKRVSLEGACKVTENFGKIVSIQGKEQIISLSGDYSSKALVLLEVATYGAGFAGFLIKERNKRLKNEKAMLDLPSAKKKD